MDGEGFTVQEKQESTFPCELRDAVFNMLSMSVLKD